MSSAIFAQTQRSTAQSSTELLKELRMIKQQKIDADSARYTRLIREFKAAAGSDKDALELYLKTIFATGYSGDNKALAQFQAWRKKNEERLERRDEILAIRMHLKYLAFTIEQNFTYETSKLVSELIEYTSQLDELDADTRSLDLLQRPLQQSIFVRQYQLFRHLGDKKEWEHVPGKANGIRHKYIFPELRKQASPVLITLWDDMIREAAMAAEKSSRTFDREQFTLYEKPSMYWQRANDILVIGQKNRAIKEMFGIIKNFPSHPDADQWIIKLEKVLSADIQN